MTSTQATSEYLNQPKLTEAERRQIIRDRREKQRLAEANARHTQSMFDMLSGRK